MIETHSSWSQLGGFMTDFYSKRAITEFIRKRLIEFASEYRVAPLPTDILSLKLVSELKLEDTDVELFLDLLKDSIPDWTDMSYIVNTVKYYGCKDITIRGLSWAIANDVIKKSKPNNDSSDSTTKLDYICRPRHCEICNKYFIPIGGRTVHCDSCKEFMRALKLHGLTNILKRMASNSLRVRKLSWAEGAKILRERKSKWNGIRRLVYYDTYPEVIKQVDAEYESLKSLRSDNVHNRGPNPDAKKCTPRARLTDEEIIASYPRNTCAICGEQFIPKSSNMVICQRCTFVFGGGVTKIKHARECGDMDDAALEALYTSKWSQLPLGNKHMVPPGLHDKVSPDNDVRLGFLFERFRRRAVLENLEAHKLEESPATVHRCKRCNAVIENYVEGSDLMCQTCKEFLMPPEQRWFKGIVGLSNRSFEDIAKLPSNCRCYYTKHMTPDEVKDMESYLRPIQHQRLKEQMAFERLRINPYDDIDE